MDWKHLKKAPQEAYRVQGFRNYFKVSDIIQIFEVLVLRKLMKNQKIPGKFDKHL